MFINFLKKYSLLFIVAFLFTACATKIEKEQDEINKKHRTELVELLIKKEQEINRLLLELESCKEQNKYD